MTPKVLKRRNNSATGAYGPFQNRVYHTHMKRPPTHDQPDTLAQPDVLHQPEAPNRPPAPAPPNRPDLDQLGDRIAELSARIQAATYDLLCDLRAFDHRHGWEGFRSCAHWLSWRTGLDLGAAREKVRVANALADLNHIGAAMACGILSYSKVRALSRVASPVTEARLLAVACGATAEQVERLVRGWRRLDRAAAAGEQEEQAWLARRGLSLRVDEEGMVVVRGLLLPEVGAVVQRALEAALEQVPAQAADGTESSGAQRRADALGVVAESALAGKLDPGSAGDRYQVTVHVEAPALVSPAISAETRGATATAREASAPTAAAADSAAPEARAISAEMRTAVALAPEGSAPASAATAYAGSHPGATSAETRRTDRSALHATPAATGAVRETVDHRGAPPAAAAVPGAAIATDARDRAAGVQLPDPPAPLPLTDSSNAGGGAVIEQGDGLFLSTAAARRIACDAGRVLLYHAPDDSVLDVGRRTRTVPTPLRRALEGRDRQRCQFPGCQNRRCDAHHLVHWADGGATRLENLVSVCRFHHRAVHEEGFQVVHTGDGRFEFRRPEGAVLPAVAAAVRWQGAPLAPTEGRLAAGGIRIGPHTATPEWYGESLDVAAALDVLWEPPPAAAGPALSKGAAPGSGDASPS